MLLEGLAERFGEMLPLDHGWRISGGTLDLLPLLAVLADETNPARGAAVFHATLAAALAEWVRGFAGENAVIVGAGGLLPEPGAGAQPAQSSGDARPASDRGTAAAAERRRPGARSGLGGDERDIEETEEN